MNYSTQRAAVVEMPGEAARLQAPALRTDAVSVVYTTVDDTLDAVRVGADLAKALGAPLHLVHFRAVPVHVPVGEPTGVSPLETDAFIERLRAEGIAAAVRVYLCRDASRTIPWAFKPHSLIVIGGRRSWWPTLAERWRDALEAAGHFVVFVDPSEHKEPSHA